MYICVLRCDRETILLRAIGQSVCIRAPKTTAVTTVPERAAGAVATAACVAASAVTAMHSQQSLCMHARAVSLQLH
jgi:hypothetical protein